MMKLSYFYLLVCLFFANSVLAQNYSVIRSVPITVVTDNSANTITLNWKTDTYASSYVIYRRDFGASSWGSALATLTPLDSTYVDNTVTANKVYEYNIRKPTAETDPNTNHTTLITGHGYVSPTYELSAVHDRGVIWILVTQHLFDSLTTEIDQLKSDLAGDGWDVYTEVIGETATVAEVKAFIDTEKASNRGLDGLYLLGAIPVPYSGTYCESSTYLFPPDGHYELDQNSHCGAWTADVYYGTSSSGWTDNDSISTAKAAKRAKNDNKIGDGKFDNNFLPNATTVQIGRVDMDSLPTFSESEVELTRRYLKKAHDYKMATTVPVMKGVIDNNFSTAGEGFSSGARRDFTAHFGLENIVYSDFFGSNEVENYLFGYAAGAGWYTSCSGIGTTGDFDTSSGAFFNHIFGSFFGDYDNPNNFMRASLASPKNNLTCNWSGRPKWISHPLAIGLTIGEVTRNTQNHGVTGFNIYEGGYYQSSPHAALLGDPSLRTVMIKPASDLVLTPNGDSTAVDLSWTASSESGITGYYVYVSHRPYGAYTLLNSTPITSTTYSHSSPWDGTNWYMVRTEKLTTTSSGTYYNLSIGERAEINGMKGAFADITEINRLAAKVYPIPATNSITLETSSQGTSEYTIINAFGQVVRQATNLANLTSIDISDLNSGIYFVSIGNDTIRFIKI